MGLELENVSPDDGYVPSSRTKSQWHSLFRFTITSHYLVLFLAVVFAVLSGVIVPALAYFLGKIFDAFTAYGVGKSTDDVFLHDVTRQALYVVILGIVNSLLSSCFLFYWLVFGELQVKTARHRLYSSMLDKEIEWFDMWKSGINALMPRVHSLIRDLQLATSQPLGFLLQYSCTIVAALGLAFYSAWDLTLVVIASAPVGAVILGLLSKGLQPYIKRQSEYLEVSTKHAAAALNAMETVKCSNGQAFESSQYLNSIKQAASQYISQARLNAIRFGIVRFLTLAIFVQGFWYGSHLVQNGTRDSGQILTAFWACLIATQTFEGLLQHLLVLEKGRSAGQILYSIVTNIDEVRNPGEFEIKPDHCHGDIQFVEVSFAYPSRPEKLVLDSVSMFFAAGETTFVVGKSGSGKSTLSGLLLGFYSAKGRLMIDNNSIDKLDRNWLRNNVTVMQQDSILFNGSILHNMAFGLRDTETIGSTVLQECIRYAALEETIMNLPDGINTMVGSGGSLLSGGQRQRIAFARAKLSDTPILVFDEATSALDRKSGDILLRGIREWRRNKTTIIITHDLSHILPDDYVYVMDRGKLVQEGYRDLLETMHGQALFDLLNYKDSKKTALPIIPASPTSSISANTFAFQGKRTQNTSLKACELPADRRNVRRRTMASPLAPLNQTQESSVQERVLPRELHDRKSLSTQSSSRQSLIRPASNLMRPQYDEFRNIIDARFQDDVEKIQPVLLENIDSDSDLDQDIKNLYQKQTMSMYQILSTVWPNLFWTQRIWLLLGYLAAVCHAASTPVFSWVFSKLLATFLSSETNKAQAALKWSLSVLTVAVTDGVLSYLMHYLLESQGQSWVDALRAKAYERILDQPLAWFDDEEHSTHKLVGCLDRSAEEMRNLLGRFVGLMIVAVTMVSIAIIWSLILCWKLTLVGIACGPFIYALTGLFNTMNARWEKKCTDAAQPVSESFNETFGNIRTVRALTLEDHLHHKLSQNTRQAMAAGIKRAAYSGLFFGASDAGVLLTIALLFWYSSTLVVYHNVSVQTIVTVVSMLLFTLTSAASMISFIPQLNSSKEAASQLLRLVNLPGDASHEHGGMQKPTRLRDHIIITNLTFTYPSRPQKPAISNLNLKIQLNKSTAIIGASGSGKSTLIAVLLGLYPPSPRNAIRVSSHLLSEFHIPTLRKIIALSPQHPPVFPASVRANIAYALSAHSHLSSNENIIQAAKLAGLHTFITSLTDGYDTMIGEGSGSLLSGGQTARLGLARAICRRPQILILDEPTAGLDGVGKGELSRVIRGLVREGVTVMVVTHDEMLRDACDAVVELG